MSSKNLARTPLKSLNKAYRKQKIDHSEIELFRKNLKKLLEELDEQEYEEHLKNDVTQFLNETWYKGDYYINTKDRADLVIHNDNKASSTVGVLLEVKKPSNKPEMVTKDKLNAKALQELVLYYLRERIEEENRDIKHIIITNVYEWFIFDGSVFYDCFFKNKKLVKAFHEWNKGQKDSSSTSMFYQDIAGPAIEEVEDILEFTYLDLREYDLEKESEENLKKLIPACKILSPTHLLNLPFVNDSNTLDRRFYNELLYIIGLEEVKEKGKKVIQRKKDPDPGSMLENTITILEVEDRLRKLSDPKSFGETTEERIFNVALQLCITWINRILFLKLLEGQLIKYHDGNEDYKFLDSKFIPEFDELHKLFFQVLALKVDERSETIKKKYDKVPYLNSSLFEINKLEDDTIRINSLDDSLELEYFSRTVLQDDKQKKRKEKVRTLHYLLEFLSAYDFSSEGAEEIQKENKPLINASVLGLIFEKINGYKDGSFFTPGFITMYMCRETIRRAIVQKFNEYIDSRHKKISGNAPLSRGAGGVSKRRKIIPYNPALKEKARELRNNSTKSEIHLWSLLKGKFEGKYDFHRQKPLDEYIADFYCHELQLVIEVDGITHDWEETQRKDFEKETRLNELKLNVLRFTDEEVLKHEESVLETIRNYINCFENNDPAELDYEDTPLNPLSRGDFCGPSESEMFVDENSMSPPLDEVGSFRDIHNTIGSILSVEEANEIINSLKICDPAVGSGHFLVSALNEIIAIKSELGILTDREGKVLREYAAEVVNDELTLSIDHETIFEYKPGNKESQRVQEAIFHEKETIIENCLFGVDINPNSVKICRLRLWIELLKSAYYTKESNFKELETLPNIDINIKQGNSLISRFSLDENLSKVLKSIKFSIDEYRSFVNDYKNATDKEEKRGFETLINQIKSDFRTEIHKRDPKVIRKSKLGGELFNLMNQAQAFEPTEKQKIEREKKKEKLEKQINKLSTEIEEIKNSKIYQDAFEWRFEFPEVLDDEGNFVGFDVVIGNPPYIRYRNFIHLYPGANQYLEASYNSAKSNYDLYVPFIEFGRRIANITGAVTFILPHKWMVSEFGKELRFFLKNEGAVESLLHFGHELVFDDVTTYTCIITLNKLQNTKIKYAEISPVDINEEWAFDHLEYRYLGDGNWNLAKREVINLLNKLNKHETKVKDVFSRIFQGLATSLDKFFVLEGKQENDVVKCYSNISQSSITLENGLVKPFIKPEDTRKYQFIPEKYFVIFPYHLSKGVAIPMSLKYIQDNFPLGYKYFRAHEDLLRSRENGRFDNDNEWFLFSRKQGINGVENLKIITPEITNGTNMTLDSGKYYHSVGCYSFILKNGSDFDYKYYLGILNSSVLWFFLRNTGNVLRGGYFRFKTKYLEPFPLPEAKIDQQKIIVQLVDKVIENKKQNPGADTSALESEIDHLVYELYGLTEKEVKIVEGGAG